MSTTPGRRAATNTGKHQSHLYMNEDPPYYGDPEDLKSGGARADEIPTVYCADSVGGEASHPDMTADFVAGHDGWPKKVEED